MDEIHKLMSLVTEYNVTIKIKTVNMVWIGIIIFRRGPIFVLYGSEFKDVITKIINTIDDIFYFGPPVKDLYEKNNNFYPKNVFG